MNKNKDLIRCSVILATFNGEKYIDQQITSILQNLTESDELIITDDGSTDSTLLKLKYYAENDHRIILVNGPKRGVVFNFENGLKCARGKYIFLCDQDDIWKLNKVDTVLSYIREKKRCLVVHDAYILNDNKILNKSFSQLRKSKSGFCYNLKKNCYIGCCMCFTHDLLPYILPFPQNICMHDQWIGLITELYGSSLFVHDRLIYYRRHQNNLSPLNSSNNFTIMIKNRWNMLFSVVYRALKRRQK